ncbi:MAG: hypothetical protein CM15mV91_670 [uncultured marine virus]|nr:MAG: hypothetical protein CM15mV91_670 [uncultured marine virus]
MRRDKKKKKNFLNLEKIKKRELIRFKTGQKKNFKNLLGKRFGE